MYCTAVAGQALLYYLELVMMAVIIILMTSLLCKHYVSIVIIFLFFLQLSLLLIKAFRRQGFGQTPTSPKPGKKQQSYSPGSPIFYIFAIIVVIIKVFRRKGFWANTHVSETREKAETSLPWFTLHNFIVHLLA
jgi:hypothetical protein